MSAGKPEVKRPLGKPRRRWEDNIRMDLQEVGGGRGDWMELAEDFVITARDLGFHKNVGNFLTSFKDLLASQGGLCSME
jgi:hypothetical protein